MSLLSLPLSPPAQIGNAGRRHQLQCIAPIVSHCLAQFFSLPAGESVPAAHGWSFAIRGRRMVVPAGRWCDCYRYAGLPQDASIATAALSASAMALGRWQQTSSFARARVTPTYKRRTAVAASLLTCSALGWKLASITTTVGNSSPLLLWMVMIAIWSAAGS